MPFSLVQESVRKKETLGIRSYATGLTSSGILTQGKANSDELRKPIFLIRYKNNEIYSLHLKDPAVGAEAGGSLCLTNDRDEDKE